MFQNCFEPRMKRNVIAMLFLPVITNTISINKQFKTRNSSTPVQHSMCPYRLWNSRKVVPTVPWSLRLSPDDVFSDIYYIYIYIYTYTYTHTYMYMYMYMFTDNGTIQAIWLLSGTRVHVGVRHAEVVIQFPHSFGRTDCNYLIADNIL